MPTTIESQPTHRIKIPIKVLPKIRSRGSSIGRQGTYCIDSPSMRIDEHNADHNDPTIPSFGWYILASHRSGPLWLLNFSISQFLLYYRIIGHSVGRGSSVPRAFSRSGGHHSLTANSMTQNQDIDENKMERMSQTHQIPACECRREARFLPTMDQRTAQFRAGDLRGGELVRDPISAHV